MKTIETIRDLSHATLRFKLSDTKPSRNRALAEQALVTLAYELAAKLEGEKSRYLCSEKHHKPGTVPGMNPAQWSMPSIQRGNDCVFVNLEHSGAADFARGCDAAAEVVAELVKEASR